VNRAAFDHAVRAAGAVLGESEILVIGSQALHGTVGEELPAEAARSVEVDVAPFDDEDEHKADLVDGSIGEASAFHEAFGYYAQGVARKTAVLPDGWEERLVRYESPATNGVVAWCLEVHDLWLSKAAAMRPKDVDFCEALVRGGVAQPEILRGRLSSMRLLGEEDRGQIGGLIERLDR